MLDELELPYQWEVVEFDKVKEEQYLGLNPNGRLPTIQDPNTGVTLWEVYDYREPAPNRLWLMVGRRPLLSYCTWSTDTTRMATCLIRPRRKYTSANSGCRSRSPVGSTIDVLMCPGTDLRSVFTGQGPYTGQATWFARFHPEKLPSAIDRYVNEIDRMFGVLDLGLERNGTGWLVGDKITYADLSFVTWSQIGEGVSKQWGRYDGLAERYPRYHKWMMAMLERPMVAKALTEIADARKAHGLP